MKVENDKKTSLLDSLVRPNQLKTQKDQSGKGVEGKGDGNHTDTVELTSRKEEIERLKERVKAAPILSQGKIDRIREAIQTETYNVKGELVARSIIKSHLLDQIL
jgi:flagellar biosynthesis anti-sigma factor FlgM